MFTFASLRYEAIAFLLLAFLIFINTIKMTNLSGQNNKKIGG